MRRLMGLAAAVAAALMMTVAAQAAGFSNIVIADDQDATESQATFATDTAEIFFTAEMEDVATGSTVTVHWIAVDTNGVAPANYDIAAVDVKIEDGMNILNSNLTKPNNGWPVGTYRVDVAVDGTMVTSSDEFEVK